MASREIPTDQKDNVEKQADQIRFCLIQAEEYYKAASVSNSTTKSLQLYYCAMSLALAESLWLGDGTISLDKRARFHHNHGLDFIFDEGSNDRLEGLAAKPKYHRGEPSGTFGLWWRHSRNLPFALDRKIIYTGDRYHNNQVDLGAISNNIFEKDSPLFKLNLLECFQNIREMKYILNKYNHEIRLVRCSASAKTQINHEKREFRNEYKYILHPGDVNYINKAVEHFSFPPTLVPYVDAAEIKPSGIAIEVSPPANFNVQYKVPSGFSTSQNDTFFYSDDHCLNEFGYLYIGLFICSNLVRYYPHKWMEEIHKSSKTYVMVDDFMSACVSRLPWLTLSALEDTVFLEK